MSDELKRLLATGLSIVRRYVNYASTAQWDDVRAFITESDAVLSAPTPTTPADGVSAILDRLHVPSLADGTAEPLTLAQRVELLGERAGAAMHMLSGFGHGRTPTTPVTGEPGILERLEAVLWEARSAYAGQFDVEDIVHHVAHGQGKCEPVPVTVTVSDADVEAALAAFDHATEWDQSEYNGNLALKLRNMGAMRAALEAYESTRGTEDGWTITKEKNPADCTDVDAIWWGGDRKMAYLRDGVWWYYGQMGVKAATVAPEYWRPLPPPPSAKARGDA